MALIAATLLCGCEGSLIRNAAAGFPGTATRFHSCATAAQCDAAWLRAREWLNSNGKYRLAFVSDLVLQTHGPLSQDYDRIAYTVTRKTGPDGSGIIAVEARCGTAYGLCGVDPGARAAEVVEAIAPP